MPLPDGTPDYSAAIDALPADPAPDAVSAPAAAPHPAGNDYSAAIDSLGRDQDAALKNSLAIGAKQEPARAARVQQLADQMHLPPGVVDRNFDEVSHAASVSSIDTAALQRSHPELAQWLSDPVNAALSHKDIDNLRHVDGAVALVNKATGGDNFVTDADFAKDDPLPFWSGVVGRGARNAFRGLAMLVSSIPATAQLGVRNLVGATGEPSPWSPLGTIYNAHDLMAAENAARQTYAPSMAKDIATGVVSLASDPTNVFLPLKAGALAAKAVPVLASAQREAAALRAAAMVQGELAGGDALRSSLEAKQERGDGTSVGWRDVANASAQAGLAFVTGKASGLIGPLASLKNQPLALSQVPHDMLANALLGGTQSLGGTVASNEILDGKTTDIKEAIRAYATGAIGGGVMSALNIPEAASVSRARSLMAQAIDAHRAQADAALLAQAGVATQNSDTAKLSPDKYASLIKAMGGGSEAMVHFNQDEWDQHWTGSNVNPESMADLLAKRPGAYAEAKATGGDIAVPFSEYQAKIANTDHYEPLLDVAKLDPQGMTLREANAFLQKSPEAIADLRKTLIDEARTNAPEHQDGADAVAKTIEKQLIDAGQDPAQAQQNAEIYGAFFQNMAKQTGSTPEEVAAQYPIAHGMEMPNDGHAMEQGVLEAPGQSLAFDDLLKQWKRANGDRSPTEGGKEWNELQQQAAAVDAARGAHYEQPGDKQPRASIRINGRNFSINLRPGSDLTSTMHEAMHAFTEIMGDLAQSGKASPQLKADYQTLLEFSGYGTHENKAAMQRERGDLITKIRAENREATPEERAQIRDLAKPHEKLSEAWEQYLLEGKAPSAEMRSTFQRFKAWFSLVYRKVGKLLDLTPEVRGVFDRMVASEDQIKAAEQRAGDRGPLTAEQLGMTPDAHSRYVKAYDASREQAETDLRTDLVKEFQKEFTARYQEERDGVRSRMEEAVNAQPEYAALRALQDGVMPDGQPVPGNFKLSRAELVDRYGEKGLRRLPGPTHKDRTNPNIGRSIYSKEPGALTLDDAAEMFGFKSGDELWHALADAPKREQVIEQRTDAAMEAKYPDALKDGSIVEKADAAMHGDKRGELLVREARALGKLANKEITPRELMASAAKETVGAQSVRSLKPEHYRANEAKAARKSFEAASRGDHETALAEKQRQILNHELVKAATDAKKATEKQVRHLSGLTAPSAQERIGKAGGWEWTVCDPSGKATVVDSEAKAQALAKSVPGSTFLRTSSYVDQINGLLARFGLGRGTAGTDSLAVFMAKQEELAAKTGDIPPQIPDAITDGSLRGDWKNLTVDQLRAVYDAAQSIEAAARQVNKFLSAERKETLSQLSGELADSIKENGPKAKGSEPGHTPWSGLTSSVGKTINFAKRVADICYRLDGFGYGTMFEKWQLPINKATDVEMERIAQETVRASGILDRWGKIGISGIHNYALHRQGYIPEIGKGLNKYDQIAVALNWGNAGNRERLMDGERLTEAQVQAILDRLDAKDVALVNDIHAHINSFKSEIIAIEQRTHGVAPEMVEPTPFSAKGGDFTGGYYPIVYDRTRSVGKHEKNTDSEIDDMLAGRGAGSSYTSHGHTKDRLGSAGDPIKLDFGVYTSHITKVVHDLALREMLNDANRLLHHKTFADAIIAHLGRGAWEQFEAQLRGVAGSTVRTNTGMEQVVSGLRQGSNAMRRAFNVLGTIKQGAGLPFIIPRVGINNFAKALGPAFWPAAHHWVEAQSVTMRYRNAERGKILNEEYARTSPFAPLGIFKPVAYMMMNKAWKILDAHAWFATYYRAQQDGHSEEHARDIADQGVADTQGATHQKDMAQMMRGGVFAQLLTNNMSWASANFNMTALSIHRFVDRQGWKNPREIAKLTSDMMCYLAVCPLVYAAVSEFASGQDMSEWEDPKKVAKKLGREGGANLLSMMPITREASSFLTQDHARWEGPQGTSALGTLVAPIADAMHPDPKHPRPGPTAGERDLIDLGGILFHFPSAQVLHMIDGWNYAEKQGLNPAWYTLIGKPPKQPKQ